MTETGNEIANAIENETGREASVVLGERETLLGLLREEKVAVKRREVVCMSGIEILSMMCQRIVERQYNTHWRGRNLRHRIRASTTVSADESDQRGRLMRHMTVSENETGKGSGNGNGSSESGIERGREVWKESMMRWSG
jgi:hypothetical protein